MAVLLPELSEAVIFPPPEQALDYPNGLLAVGGDLTPERLSAAYQYGIFPWYNPGERILWWSPDPRAVLLPEKCHISRSLQRALRRTSWQLTLNHAFAAVIEKCAQRREAGTWITPEIQRAYIRLHHMGQAHSIEVWQQDELVGGMYGVEQGALFCGESMFSRCDNASKVALVAFCHHFHRYGGELIDCQVINAHTASLGAEEISRYRYLQQLKHLQQQTLPRACWEPQIIPALQV